MSPKLFWSDFLVKSVYAVHTSKLASLVDLDRPYQGWGISAEFEPRSVFHGDVAAELLEDQSGIWNLQARRINL